MKIPGVYVEIRGDMAHLNKEMTKARQLVTEKARGMSNAINNSISDKQVKSSVNNLVGNLGSLSRASKLTGNEFSKIGVDLGSLRSITGMTSEQFGKLQSRMLATQSAKQQENSLKGIARSADLTKKEIRELGRQFGLSKAQIDNVNNSLHRSSTRMSALGVASRSLFAFVSVAALVQVGRSAVTIADQYTLLDSKLKLATKSTEEFNSVYAELFNISQTTGSSFSDNASNFSNLSLALRDANISSAETLKIFDLLNKTLIVAGASTAEASSFTMQFRQALGSGVLQGEEFRAMMESNSYFGGQLAKVLDTDIAGLRAMSKEGKLTTDVLRKAFPAMAAQVEKDFGGIQKTISRAMVELRNAFSVVISDANRATGGTSSVADSISELAQTIIDHKQIFADTFVGLVNGAGAATNAIATVAQYVQGLAIVLASEDKNFFDLISSSPKALKGWQDEIKSGVAFLKDQLKVVSDEAAQIEKVRLFEMDNGGWTEDAEKRYQDILKKRDSIVKRIKEAQTKPPVVQDTKTGEIVPNKGGAGNKITRTSGNALDPLDPYSKLGSSLKSYYSSLDSLMQKEAERTSVLRESMNATNLHILGLNGVNNAAGVAEDSWVKLIELAKDYDKTVANIDKELAEFFDDMPDGAEQAASEMQNAVSGWAAGFSGTLTDMLTGSDTTFSEISHSFSKMIIQMIIQKKLIEPFLNKVFTPTAAGSTAGGWAQVGASVMSLFAHSGGIPGTDSLSARAVPMSAFSGAKRYHSGLMPDEFPAILQKGEGVFTEGQMKALGGSGGNNSDITALLREVVTAVRNQSGPKIINALGDKEVAAALSGSAGEKVFTNFLVKNGSMVKRVALGG